MPVAPTRNRYLSQSVTVSVMVSRQQRGRELTGSEARLVRYLAGHAGRFVEEWELRDHLYGGACGASVIREMVRRIRAKLGRAFIETGELGGYRLTAQRAVALERVCARCGRPVVQYEDEWVCYGCPSTQYSELDVGRAEGPGERSGTAWTEDEDSFLIDHLDHMSLEQLGTALNRSESAVRGEAAILRAQGIIPDERKRYVKGSGR